MAVPEFWAGMQLSVGDFVSSDVPKYQQLVRLLSYSDFIKTAGEAFHISSAGHYVLAVLLLPRFSTFGMLSVTDAAD